MKKIVAFTALAGFQLAAAQQTQQIKPFTNLAVSGNMEITLVQSKENKLVVTEGNPDNLNVATEEGALALGTESSKEEFDITIHYNGKLESIAVSGGAEVNAREAIKSKNLMISAAAGSEVNVAVNTGDVVVAAASGAEITLKGTAKTNKAAIASGAELNAASLKATEVEVTVASGGEATVYASTTVEATVASGGELNIHGNPKDVHKTVAQGGAVNILK